MLAGCEEGRRPGQGKATGDPGGTGYFPDCTTHSQIEKEGTHRHRSEKRMSQAFDLLFPCQKELNVKIPGLFRSTS